MNAAGQTMGAALAEEELKLAESMYLARGGTEGKGETLKQIGLRHGVSTSKVHTLTQAYRNQNGLKRYGEERREARELAQSEVVLRRAAKKKEKEKVAVGMREAFFACESLESIGSRHKVSAERVRQIIAAYEQRNGLPTRGRARPQWLVKMRGIVREKFVELGDEHKVVEAVNDTAKSGPCRLRVADVRQVVKEEGLESYRRYYPKAHKASHERKSYTDEEILACLTRAAACVDGGARPEACKAANVCASMGAEKVLSLGMYSLCAQECFFADGKSWPSPKTCIARNHYDSWSDALTAAGLTANPAKNKPKSKYSHEEYMLAIGAYLRVAAPAKPACARYREWARKQKRAPSLGSVRNHFKTWTNAFNAYLAYQQEQVSQPRRSLPLM